MGLSFGGKVGRHARGTVRWTGLALVRPWVKPDPRKALLVFASPRGGSTWLEELLRTVPATATLWEPLDIARNQAFERIGFWWRQYIPPDAEWPEAEVEFERLFAGKRLSPYLTQTSSLKDLVRAERLIIKFVRGNRLLPWLVGRFELPPPVLFVRHPCAVVASQLRYGAWSSIPRLSEVPPHRYDDLLSLERELAGSDPTPEERLAALWCMDHLHALTDPRCGDAWSLVTYEQLVLDPAATLTGLFTRWGLDVPDRALEIARRPSRTTLQGGGIATGEQDIDRWRQRLTHEQVERILAIVARAGISLYDEESLPHLSDPVR